MSHLPSRERKKPLQMIFEPRSKQPIAEHRQQRRRDRNREPVPHVFPLETIEQIDEGKVTLPERLVEPAFLERPFVLRMPHVRKVRVKNDRDVHTSALLQLTTEVETHSRGLGVVFRPKNPPLRTPRTGTIFFREERSKI